MKCCLRLGRVVVELCGEGPLFKSVLEEIPSQLRIDDGARADIIFEFGKIDVPKQQGIHLAQYVVGHNWVLCRDKYIPHIISLNEDQVRVVVDYNVRLLGHPLVSPLLCPWDVAFADVWSRLSRRFYYTVFLQVAQLFQVSKGQTFCHASSCTDGERTIMLMAWGGIGKTSSLVRLLNSAGQWRFISDDLAILDDEGVVHRNPLKMQIYPYNLQGEPELGTALLKGRSWADRLQWAVRRRLLGDKGVRRRVQAEALFGEHKGAASARLTHTLFLRRTNVEDFTDHPLSIVDGAAQMAHVMQYELRTLWAMIAAMGSSGPASQGFGFGTDSLQAMDSVARIVERGLGGLVAPPLLVDVPLGAKPADLEQAVLARVGGR